MSRRGPNKSETLGKIILDIAKIPSEFKADNSGPALMLNGNGYWNDYICHDDILVELNGAAHSRRKVRIRDARLCADLIENNALYLEQKRIYGTSREKFYYLLFFDVSAVYDDPQRNFVDKIERIHLTRPKQFIFDWST